MHADQEAALLAEGADRRDLWGRNDALARGALERALELIDLTLDDPRHRRSPARLREIARTRELVVDFFAGANEYGSTAAGLQKYFDAYALAVRP